MYRAVLTLLVMVLMIGPAPARADQTDAGLTPLFQRLLITEDSGEAATIEEQIWRLWIYSGRDAVDRRMEAGIHHMGRGELRDALNVFDDVVGMAPNHAEGWNKRATVHYLMGNLEASVRDIQETLNLEPRHFGALSGLGLIYSQLDRLEAALKAFEGALKIHPHQAGIKANIKALRDALKGRAT